MLRQLVLQDRVVTMEAFLTQRHVAQTIVDTGGDDVMIVKGPQPQLPSDMALVFTQPPAGDQQQAAQTVGLGHGRIEPRTLTTSEALVGDSDWPGLAQVFERGRHVITKKTGEERVEGVYGVTSLRPERVTPEQWLALVRGHWHMENTSHWVRDVTFDEDRSQVRCGSIPRRSRGASPLVPRISPPPRQPRGRSPGTLPVRAGAADLGAERGARQGVRRQRQAGST